MELKVGDVIKFKCKRDYGTTESRITKIDDFGNIFVLHDTLRIGTVCKIEDVIEVVN